MAVKIGAVTMTPYKLILLMTTLLMFATSSYAYVSVYDHPIQRMVIEEAEREGVDPALALAIAKVESDFRPRAVSRAGARGVMQIMPATSEQEFGISRHRLFNPRVNVRIGVQFINHLIDAYDGRVDIALSHYNGGSKVKDKWGNLRIIPATRNYVLKVLDTKEVFYSKLRMQQDWVSTARKSRSNDSSNYARLMELDDFSRDRNEPVVLQVVEFSNQEIKHSNPKIQKLRELQLHNVMRNQRKINNISENTEENQNLATNILDSKRAKVAKWESIFK